MFKFSQGIDVDKTLEIYHHLELLKVVERFMREGILTQGLEGMTKYLNQFIIPQHQIQYIPFDMARIKKRLSRTILRANQFILILIIGRINKFALIDLIKLSKKVFCGDEFVVLFQIPVGQTNRNFPQWKLSILYNSPNQQV